MLTRRPGPGALAHRPAPGAATLVSVILGIDTSIGTAVAVVGDDGELLAEAASPDPRGHAEVIGDLLVRVLHDAGPGPVRAVVAGMGPGPFTGLRVGIAAARAFALGRGIPVIEVASHDAAALAVAEGTDEGIAEGAGEAAAIAIVTDARRRELAVSVYRLEHGAPRLIDGPRLVPRASDEPVDPFGVRAAELPETGAISAAALARIGAARLRSDAPGGSGVVGETASEPLYLRAPDVSVPAGVKRVGT